MPGTQPTAFVNTIAVQPDGLILLGGFFGAFDAEDQFRNIIRLTPDELNSVHEAPHSPALRLLTDPATGAHHLLLPLADGARATLRIHATSSLLLHERPITAAPEPIRIDAPLPDGVFVVSVEHHQQRYAARLVNSAR